MTQILGDEIDRNTDRYLIGQYILKNSYFCFLYFRCLLDKYLRFFPVHDMNYSYPFPLKSAIRRQIISKHTQGYPGYHDLLYSDFVLYFIRELMKFNQGRVFWVVFVSIKVKRESGSISWIFLISYFLLLFLLTICLLSPELYVEKSSNKIHDKNHNPIKLNANARQSYLFWLANFVINRQKSSCNFP